jgi:hypothetical protein
MASEPGRYVFQHVPKTAGTSLWVAFVGLFGRDQVSDPVGSEEFMTDEEAAALRRYRLVSGHLSRRDIVRHFPDLPVLTVVRHPLDREISSYYFHRALPTPNMANEMTIDEFFFRTYNRDGTRELWNRQVRQLGGQQRDSNLDLRAALAAAKENLKRCAWLGVYDRLDADLERLRRLADFSDLPALPNERVTEVRPACDEVPEQLRRRILDTHPYDLELYHWAREYCAAQG